MEIRPKKSLGQHFLNNPRIPKHMADAAALEKRDIVLEIGPGTGVLTRELLARSATVIAIEADIRAVESLKETFKNEIGEQKLILIHGDIRTIDLAALGLRPRAFKIVANIPYYLSGILFRRLLEGALYPSLLVFLVQREVAYRIARDTKASLLSLSVRAFGRPHYIQTVAPGNFTPPPRVDSAIISIDDISHNHFHTINKDLFFKILHVGFGSKRKQLLGNLTKLLNREDLERIFQTLGIQKNVRGEDLALEVWFDLTTAIALHL